MPSNSNSANFLLCPNEFSNNFLMNFYDTLMQCRFKILWWILDLETIGKLQEEVQNRSNSNLT